MYEHLYLGGVDAMPACSCFVCVQRVGVFGYLHIWTCLHLTVCLWDICLFAALCDALLRSCTLGDTKSPRVPDGPTAVPNFEGLAAVRLPVFPTLQLTVFHLHAV